MPGADSQAVPVTSPDARPHRRHPLIQAILQARGLTDPNRIDRFLKPRLTDLEDPAELPGCQEAATRLVEAMRQGRTIVVYGDYDVDGVCASTILYHTLGACGRFPVTYLPHRVDEGYGLHTQAIDQLAQQHPRCLLVTVDCGITARDAVRHAVSLGLEVIITDHHHIDPDRTPVDAMVIVHPEGLHHESNDMNRSGKATPLCGAGVALKLAWQVARTHCGSDRLPTGLRDLMMDLLAFAALGTVADVVPLIDDNRVLTVSGLARIRNQRFPGLPALIAACDLDDEAIDAQRIGFSLGPRLNAIGRLGHAEEALQLFLTTDPDEARRIAQRLNRVNQERRELERTILAEACEAVDAAGHATDERRALVVAGEAWHLGVVGIVASRLVEKYHRPTVVLTIDPETGTARGSARSVPGVDLYACLEPAKAMLTRFGGHAMAAGMALDADRIDDLREHLVSAVNACLPVEDLCAQHRIDAVFDLADCELPLFEKIEELGPFGSRNARPVLLIQHAIVAQPPRRIGKQGQHVQLTIKQDTGQGERHARLVGFGHGDAADELGVGDRIDVLAKPCLNHFNGRTAPDLHLVDYRPAGG